MTKKIRMSTLSKDLQSKVLQELSAKEQDANLLDLVKKVAADEISFRQAQRSLAELIAHGADLEVKDSQGQTPLFIAARFGHLDLVKLLLKAGADYYAEAHNRGLTVRDIALQNRHIEVADEILEKARTDYIKHKTS